MKRLLEIQAKLKAPKSQYNDFWKYKYRSCEDILQAVKPLLDEQKLVLILCDEVECVWERTYSRDTDDSKKWVKESINETWWRYYIKATAKLFDEEWKLIIQTTAFAREEEEKKWQDWSQVSWSSSSYARKYALCWMFLIDDWIDSDTTNKWEVKEEKKEKAWFNDEQLNSFIEKWKAKECWTFEKWIAEIKKYYRISKEMETKVKKLFDDLEIINS